MWRRSNRRTSPAPQDHLTRAESEGNEDDIGAVIDGQIGRYQHRSTIMEKIPSRDADAINLIGISLEQLTQSNSTRHRECLRSRARARTAACAHQSRQAPECNRVSPRPR